MKHIVRTLLISLLLITAACTEKDPGFGLEDSPIRYQTKKFEDPEVLAEVNGVKYMKGQILDKSPVLKDLVNQENEALIGLAYLRVADLMRAAGQKSGGAVEIYLPEAKSPLPAILNRLGREPVAGLTVVYKKPAGDGVIARLRDIEVKAEELNTNHVVFQAIEQRTFREVASQLNGQLTRILISEKAQGSGIDMQTFLKNQVFGGHDVQVSASELDEYLQKIGVSKQELTDELRPRMLDAIKLQKQQHLMENYVAQNILKGPMTVSFSEAKVIMKLNDNWTPVMGYKDAPVSLIAFSSASCPDCSRFIQSVLEVMKRYDGHLKLNWIHDFNTTDGIAKMMAEAALCVDSVKNGKSVEFMNAFSAISGTTDERAFYAWAGKNGVNPEAFKRCFTEHTTEPLLAQHLDYARRVGIVANPTLWIEGRTLQGVISNDQLDLMVQQSIRAKGSSPFMAFIRRIKGLFS